MLVNHQHYRTIWTQRILTNPQATVAIVDQTKLPHAFEVLCLNNLTQMVQAIKTMQVRGAPLIGAAAAYGMALAAQEDSTDSALQAAASCLRLSRPTAVNLNWAVSRMLDLLLQHPQNARAQIAWAEAEKICDEDVMQNQAIGRHGLALIQQTPAKNAQIFNVLTH